MSPTSRLVPLREALADLRCTHLDTVSTPRMDIERWLTQDQRLFLVQAFWNLPPQRKVKDGPTRKVTAWALFLPAGESTGEAASIEALRTWAVGS